MLNELIELIEEQIHIFECVHSTEEEKVNASIIIKNLSEAIKNLER